MGAGCWHAHQPRCLDRWSQALCLIPDNSDLPPIPTSRPPPNRLVGRPGRTSTSEFPAPDRPTPYLRPSLHPSAGRSREPSATPRGTVQGQAQPRGLVRMSGKLEIGRLKPRRRSQDVRDRSLASRRPVDEPFDIHVTILLSNGKMSERKIHLVRRRSTSSSPSRRRASLRSASRT